MAALRRIIACMQVMPSGVAAPVPDNLYSTVSDWPAKVVKTELTGFTKVGTLDLSTNYACDYTQIKDGFLYIAITGSDPTTLIKVNLATFTEVGTLTLDAGEGYPKFLLIVGDYLYVALDTAPGKIVKVSLATFTKVSTLNLGDGDEWSLQCLVTSGNYLYTSTLGYDAAPRIVKVDLTTFTRVGAIVFAYPDDSPVVLSLAISGAFLYGSFGARIGQYPRIVKVSLATFTEVDRLELIAYATGAANDFLVVKDTFLYGACLDTIFKVNLTTFAYVTNIPKPTGWRYPCGLVIGGNYLYVAYGNESLTLARISKVDLTTFSIVDNLALDADETINWYEAQEQAIQYV